MNAFGEGCLVCGNPFSASGIPHFRSPGAASANSKFFNFMEKMMENNIETRFKYALPSDYFREEQEHDSEQWSHKVILLLDKSIQRYSTVSLAMFEIYSEMETAELFNKTVEELQKDCRDGLFLMPLLDLDGDPHWLVRELVLWQCAECPPMHAWDCDKAMEEHLGEFRDIIWQMYARQMDAPHKDCS